MVVCTYFNQGYCRYGDRCRFDHPFKGPTAGAGTQYSFGGKPQQQASAPAAPSSFTELLNGIATEMKTWENSKQWPFSCFSPLKGQPCIPGLSDLSPEEVRSEAYKSRAANTPDAYLQFFNTQVAEYRQKRASLHNASPEMRAYMQQMFSASVSGASTSSQSGQSLFSGGSAAAGAGGLFGKSAGQQGSAFGGPQNTSGASVFAAQPQTSAGSVFGGQTKTASVFGGQARTASVFGGQSTGSVFGGQTQQKGSVFGGQTQSTGSVFGGQNPQAGSVFGGQNQQAGSVFGGQTQSTGSVFGGKTQSTGSVFGGQNQQASSAFGGSTQQTASVFGSQPSTQPPCSVFGGQSEPAAAPGGLFGKAGPQQPPADPDCYSQPAELSDEDRGQFAAAEFSLGKVPLLPPTREMCAR